MRHPLIHISGSSWAPVWIVPLCPSKRRPDDDAPGKGVGQGLGRLYGMELPLRTVRLRGCRGSAPVISTWASAPPFRRDAPVLNRAFSGSSNGGASLSEGTPERIQGNRLDLPAQY